MKPLTKPEWFHRHDSQRFIRLQGTVGRSQDTKHGMEDALPRLQHDLWGISVPVELMELVDEKQWWIAVLHAFLLEKSRGVKCQMLRPKHQIKAPSITGHLLRDVVFNKKNPSGITFTVQLQTK